MPTFIPFLNLRSGFSFVFDFSKGTSVSTGDGYYGGLGISPPIEEGAPWSIMLSAGFGLSAYVALEKYF